jgi:bacterioferritin
MTAEKQALVDGLNIDLAHEYGAVLMYTTYSALVRGIHRKQLRDFFQEEVPDELRHAQFLADKIVALGGTPTTTPAEVPVTSTSREMIEQVRQAEADTIVRYVERMKQAEEVGDYGLANDLHEIISDETRHKEEAEMLLRGDWTE